MIDLRSEVGSADWPLTYDERLQEIEQSFIHRPEDDGIGAGIAEMEDVLRRLHVPRTELDRRRTEGPRPEPGASLNLTDVSRLSSRRVCQRCKGYRRRPTGLAADPTADATGICC